jgi:hypothetical protein
MEVGRMRGRRNPQFTMLAYNLMFRWFLDTNPIEPSFDPNVLTTNRERLLKHVVG